jgi:hypothetical protein
MTEISQSELQHLIIAMKDRRPKPPLRPNIAEYGRIVALRQSIGKRIEPLLAKAGLDIDQIKTILTEGQTDLRKIKKRQNIKNTFSGSEESVRRDIANRHKALRQLVNPSQPPALPTFIGLDTPFLIWPSPAGILIDQHIEPANNWAKIFSSVKTTDQVPLITESQSVSFYFLWKNQSESPAVVNINAPVVLKGVVDQWANSEILFAGWVNCYGYLSIQMVQPESAGEVDIGLWGLLSTGLSDLGWAAGSDEEGPVVFFSRFDLQSNSLSIAPNTTAVFEVSLNIGLYIDDGWTGVDFSDNGGFVQCPFFQLELLTPPAENAPNGT